MTKLQKRGKRDRIVKVDHEGDYILAKVEVNGKLMTGKYFRFAWVHQSRSAEEEADRLLLPRQLRDL